MLTKRIIDVHSHFAPKEYIDAVRGLGNVNANGDPVLDGYFLPTNWNVEDHLKTMDANGIAKCILSAGEINFVKDKAEVVRLERAFNHTAKEIVTGHPDRFGAFINLPMPYVDATLEEIAYGFDELHFDGVCLHTNYHNRYLGDELFAPVMDELNRRKAVVFVHPISPEVEGLTLGEPGPMLEFPFDSTRNVVTLIKSGTIERCPAIKFIITHGGGTLPFLAPRIAPLLAMGNNKVPAEVYMKQVISQIQSLYFDLTAATHAGALAAIKALMPASRLLMGFDYPLMPPTSIPKAIEEFLGNALFSNEEKQMIFSGNGLFSI